MTNLFLLAGTVADIEGDVNAFSIRVIAAASLLLVVLLASSTQINKRKYKHFKKPLFIAVALTIILPSLLLMGSTVYINTISESKGPVHWHTDIEFWACGQEIELRDPYEFLSNKIGTASYHEHNDKRIHLEGVVIDKSHDASLEKFMSVTGGSVTRSSIIIPTNDNIIEDDIDGDTSSGDPNALTGFKKRDGEGRMTLQLRNGDSCGTYNDTELQAFLLHYNKGEDTYYQTKLDNPSRYTMRDEPNVPPGDCLIVEFDTSKTRTDKLCQQYGVRDKHRCTQFGVSQYDSRICNIEEVPYSSGGAE